MNREPFYSCEGSDYCASEQSYPANMLREYEGKIWCQVCWEDAPVIWLDDEQEDLLQWSDLPPFVPEHDKRISAGYRLSAAVLALCISLDETDESTANKLRDLVVDWRKEQ